MTNEVASPRNSDGATHTRAVMVVVALGTLLIAMAGSSVNLALPALGRDLSIPIELAGWVVESFLLVVTVLLLLAGRVADQVGHRLVYLLGYVVFGIGSVGCGLADTFWLLVAARVVQGVGSAMVMATGPALLTTTFPPNQRGKALGMLGSSTYVGLTIGPPLGGWLIAMWGWRSVFWLNVPTSVLLVALGWFLLPSTGGGRRRSADIAGAATLVVGLPLALLALAQGASWGWTSAATLGCAAGGVLILTAFLLVERRSEAPLLELSLFRSLQFSGAALSAVCNYIALFAAIILLPYALLEGLEVSQTTTGMLLSVQSILMALAASPAGWASDRIGSRWLATAGMLVLAGGLWGLSTIGPGAEVWDVALWLAVMGLGTGLFISPNSSSLMGAAPRSHQGVAGGVLAVARNLGMLLGIAIAVTVFRSAGGRTGHHWTETDFAALRVALWVAAGASLLGGVVAAFRGRSEKSQGVKDSGSRGRTSG